MSAGDGGQSRHDATIIAELRGVRGRIGAKLSMSVTLEEVDALLRAVDERDELRRQTVGDLETGFPPVRVTSVLPMSEEELPLSIPTAAEWIDAQPKSAGPAMSCPRRDTIHDCPLGGCADTTPRVSEIPDLPVGREERETPPDLLPFCDCGSVDKYGDDIGEHGPRCPYHLAVLRVSPMMSARELDALCLRTLKAMARAL